VSAALWIADGSLADHARKASAQAVQRLGINLLEVDAGHCLHVPQPEVVADILAQT
jgi:hypothetical protein